MLLVAYEGTVAHDPANGASLWLVGEIFLVVQGALIFGAARLGTSAGLRIRS
jgi:hypothetical protein